MMSFATYIIMYYEKVMSRYARKSDELICELDWRSYSLQAQNIFFLFITFDMQDLSSPFLITSVAQLELNYSISLMATAVVLHVYFTKKHFTLELSSWTWTNGSDLRGVMELPLPSAALHQLLLTENLLRQLLYFQVKFRKMTLPCLEKYSHTTQRFTYTYVHTLTCFM